MRELAQSDTHRQPRPDRVRTDTNNHWQSRKFFVRAEIVLRYDVSSTSRINVVNECCDKSATTPNDVSHAQGVPSGTNDHHGGARLGGIGCHVSMLADSTVLLMSRKD